MSVGGVGHNAVHARDLYTNTTSVSVQGRDNDGDTDGARGGGVGRISNAINQTLTQLGLTPPDASGSGAGVTDPNAAQDPKQAERAFAHALFDALQSQSGAPGQAKGPHTGGHRHAGGPGGASKIETGLQNLIQQLGSAGTPDTSGNSSNGGALSALQTSFNNLLSANGGNGNAVSLKTFLQDLAQKLQGAPSTGNVVSTKV